MGSWPDTVEELLQVVTLTGVLGERKMHQRLGNLVLTGFA
jgi:hypothetical protein